MGDQSRMTLPLVSRLWRRGLLLACLLFTTPAWSADILLTAAEDSAGVQAFTQALVQQRPEDHVAFTLLADLPAPSQLPATTRLILLDLPGLDWRLQDSQGPPTLVLRISRLQAHQR
ncbi:MAG: transporter substrate-binding protein, partial [Pseudomonas orientalis]|nr:transporter substrate-binding protein [Pseudomonas orientalis]